MVYAQDFSIRDCKLEAEEISSIYEAQTVECVGTNLPLLSMQWSPNNFRMRIQRLHRQCEHSGGHYNCNAFKQQFEKALITACRNDQF